MSDEVKKTIEGTDVKNAIDIAAEEFGVSTSQIRHKLDMSHFRSDSGSMVSRDTVKIVAWVSDEKEVAPKPVKKAPVKEVIKAEKVETISADEPEVKAEAEAEVETETEVETEADSSPNAEAEAPEEQGVETEASKIAVAWFEAVLPMMGITGSVTATGTEDRIRLIVSADPAGRLIGRRGATLDAIRHILRRILEDKGDF
ncbi:MAG: KH domain-containing protein, partial [Acidimicrobiales bacterium]